MKGQKMDWKIIPVNKRILLEKVVLDTSSTKIGGVDFLLPEQNSSNKYEFFRVLDIDTHCDKMVWKIEKGDLVVSENAVPIGKFGTRELFLSPENSITAIIKENK